MGEDQGDAPRIWKRPSACLLLRFPVLSWGSVIPSPLDISEEDDLFNICDL